VSGHDKAIVETLDEAECLRLVSAEVIGRLAFVGSYDLTVQPVNYRLDGGAILFPGGRALAGRGERPFHQDHAGAGDRPPCLPGLVTAPAAGEHPVAPARRRVRLSRAECPRRPLILDRAYSEGGRVLSLKTLAA
jgi:hypothetical protein